jgi:hypothetical protein
MANDPNAAVPTDGGSPDNGPDESALFADVLKNSALLSSEVEPLPENDDAGNQEDSDDDSNLEESDDAENDDNEEGEVPAEGDADTDDDSDDDSTEGDDDDSGEEAEIDWEFEVPMKVDGEDINVSLEEMKKGYSTQQHLSKQGRELGDERKAFEAEKTEKMEALVATADLLIDQSMTEEKGLAAKYTELTEEYKQLKKDGDKFGANDKRDDIQEAQAAYWKARKGRETLQENIKAAKESDAQEAYNAEVEKFAEEIVELIPNFDAPRATLIREFALEQGISEELLNHLANAPAIKLLDEFRILKLASTKGKAKRKTIKTKKSTPMKRPKTTKQKQTATQENASRRLASGEATEDEGFDLLRSMAQKHF